MNGKVRILYLQIMAIIKKRNKNRNIKKSRINDKNSGKFDGFLFIVIVMLSMFGLLMISSSGSVYAMDRFGDLSLFFTKQVKYLLLGFVILLIMQKIDYNKFRKLSLYIFIASIVLLIMVLISNIGISGNGATRWIKIGGFSFQPTEFVKLSVILYFSAWCASRGEKIKDLKEGLVPFLIMLTIVSIPIAMQPDIGSLSFIVLISISIFFLAGASLKHLFLIGIAGTIIFSIFVFSSEYRMERVNTFLHPELDPNDSGYQIRQASIAIGSGGLYGVGLGHSKQSKGLFLPEPVGDSIFAIISEEFGFVGSVTLVFVFLFLIWRIFKIAMLSDDIFARLVVSGIGIWIVGQAYMNIMAITGLMPLTGIPLSFISYGGSSLIAMMMAMGIILNISRHVDEKYNYK